MSLRRGWVLAMAALLPLVGRAQSSTLVISQLYTAGGTSGATYTYDYAELFNKSSAPVSLSGYSLVYTNSGGSSSPAIALTATASIPAGGYYLVQFGTTSASVGGALPTPNQTNGTNLVSTGGRLDLQLSGALIDRVGYGPAATLYEGTGPAPAPTATQAIFRPLGGCADTDDNKADFSLAAAAPRNAAAAGNPCNAPAPAITSFSPTTGPAGTLVSVSGTGFTSSTTVAFNGTAAARVVVNGPTSLTATVPGGASSGPLAATAAGGTGVSAASFTVTVPTLTASPAALTGLAASQGAASGAQTYQLSGSALDGTSVGIAASAASLEVSLDGLSYAPAVSVPLNGSGTLGATTVYVRLASGTAQGSVSGSIANTSGAAASTVAVQGAVLAPTVAKRWLGGAGTSSWFDAGNWEGGTLPGTGDDVVLDHRYVSGKYTVVLGNGASTAPTAVTVASLRLRPGSSGDSILFSIPVSNTVASASTSTSAGAALNLTRSAAGDTALVVGRRGFFTNASGASGGIVLDAAGTTNATVFLLNGGSYRHQTIRSITSLLENLSGAAGTEAGTFYYRIPGTSSTTVSLTGRTYGNLVFQRPGATASINYNASGGNALTVNGTLATESGATLNYNVLANLVLRGSLANGGAFRFDPNTTSTAATYRLVLQGTAPQVLAGNALTDPGAGTGAQSSYLAALVQLEVSNPAGATLQAPVTLSNALVLTSGLLTTDATNILTMTLAGTGAVQGGSDASFVSGPVRRPVGTVTSATAYVFPLGKGAAYRPLTLTVSTQTGTTNYRAEQFEGNPSRTLTTTDPNGALTRVSSVRFFTLTPYNSDVVPVVSQPLGFSGAVTLTYGADDGVTSAAASTLVIGKRSDATQPWANVRRGSSSGTASGGLVTSGTITSFSDFALASTDPATTANPLPVQLVRFAATRQPGGPVALAWTTASELNAARFEVERSPDGAAFGRVATLGAQGTSTQARTYAARDADAPASALYYRLRLLDQDGTSAYSPTVLVAALVTNELTLSPNPAHDYLVFWAAAPAAYTVRSVLGQEVLRGTAATGPSQLAVGQLPAGVYLLELRTEAGRVVRRFAKE